MYKLFILVLAITALDYGSPVQRYPNRSGSGTNKCLNTARRLNFKIIDLHDDVTLTCPFKAKSITFLKNCRDIPNGVGTTGSKNVKISKNKLTITNFLTMDSGMYSCQGTFADGSIKEFSWVLHIKIVHPTPTKSNMKRSEEPVGGAVVMDCRYSKVGKLLYYSHKKTLTNTSILSRVPNNRVVGDKYNGIYELHSLTMDDTGYYYCGDINKDNGKWIVIMHLVVRELPKVNVIAKQKEVKGEVFVNTGESVTLECSYTGPQKFSWYKNRKPVPEGEVQQVQKGHMKILKLEIEGHQFPKYSTVEYACGAKFEDGSIAFQPIKLRAFDFEDKSSEDTYDTPGLPVIMNCRSNVGFHVSYALLKAPVASPVGSNAVYVRVDSGKLKGQKNNGLYEPIPGVFIIGGLSAKHEGRYKCRATLLGELTIEKSVSMIWLSPALLTTPASS